jgi:hypothetical protein
MRENHLNCARCLLMAIALVAAPGAMAQPGLADLKLPVPRTFDLTHVEPVHYAVALGKDPVRIFEFVRDQIGYEVYTGALRGPRGTLLALAGNSVDRAALLASLLKESGHRVRFVRGTLPKAEARKLVDSMWAVRSQPAPAKAEGEPSPALKAALDTLVAGVKRDYTLIREHLKKANITPSPQSAPSLDSLAQEAQEHYWIQWWKDSAWVDLDPSFADAAPGRKYAPVAGSPLDAIPDALFHRVTIRVRLEEYSVLSTGNAEGKPSSREILTYTTKAAELSGVDIILSHQPENWQGPATSLSSALASAIGNTGRVKPVLIIGAQSVMGEAFRQKPPTGAGIGSMKDLLSGAGTRDPVPIATAETIEFEFVYPGGRKEIVAREIFDMVGKARRRPPVKNLSADEVRARTGAKTAFDVALNIYDLYFTTGRLEAAHLMGVVDKPPGAKSETPSVRTGLRRINIAFASASDVLLPRVGKPERAVILFFPDSPRVQIAEIATVEGKPRLSLDLRRNHTRAVVVGSRPEDIFFARVLRGIVDSTLERSLVASVIAAANDEGWKPVMSTSSLFEQAQAKSVQTELLTGDGAPLEGISENTRARIREDLGNRHLVVVPKQAIAYDEQPRFAWWRIDVNSGELLGITDEGLHQATVEYHITKENSTYEVDVFVNGRWRYTMRIESGIEDLARYVRYLERVRQAAPIDPESAIWNLLFPG